MTEQEDKQKWVPAGELVRERAKQRDGPESSVYTVALAELAKIHTLSSGSHSAAVAVKDILAAELPDEMYKRIEPNLRALVNNTSETAEGVLRIEQFLSQSARESAKAIARTDRIAWIAVGVGIIGIVVAVMIALRWIG